MSNAPQNDPYIFYSGIYAPLHDELRAHPAYQALTPTEKLVYVEFLSRYNQKRRTNKPFELSYGKIIDSSISRSAWETCTISIANKGFVKKLPRDKKGSQKTRWKLSNRWKGNVLIIPLDKG